MPETGYTDPPGMPADERMSAAELRTVREFLGLTGDWLAAHLHVDPRTYRRWEQGTFPIPDGVRLEVERLELITGEYVGYLVQNLNGEDDPAITVYRTDERYREADSLSPMPAAWHRAACYRASLEVPGLPIDYPPPATIGTFPYPYGEFALALASTTLTLRIPTHSRVAQ